MVALIAGLDSLPFAEGSQGEGIRSAPLSQSNPLKRGKDVLRGLASLQTNPRRSAARYSPATVSSISCATTASMAAWWSSPSARPAS